MFSILANPKRFLSFARVVAPVFGLVALATICAGIWMGLWNSPEDYQQGHSVRIMYVHVPAAWASMMAYGVMAIFSLIAYVWRHPIADEIAKAAALPGLAFTFLALLTGGLWGKLSWGTYWQWDGRMTSYLLLFFLYVGYLSIWETIENKKKAARIAGLVAMVGSINLPIIKFSVDWWNSLHQTSTISSLDAPGLPAELLWPLLLMFIGYSFFFGWVVINRVRYEIYKARKIRKSKSPAPNITLEKL
ncbi:MAG: heme ABC transporter permease [Acidimicrobiales bacterium]|nr:heme ABC transporter permease [Hyphomonadaceae bacterium]RZV38169.1 MAG: heme ABC transporter permease [Acidimicrobiales bacterium]